MATDKGLQELIGRAVVDADFRKQLAEDPTKAAASMGVSLTEEQVAGLRATDFTRMAGNVDERLSKAWRPGLW